MARKRRNNRQKISNKSRIAADKLERAATQLAAGDFAGAAQTCRRALDSASDNGPAWHVLAVAELQMGELEAASDSVAHALMSNPSKTDFRNTQATILQKRGEYAEAASIWREILVADPGHADNEMNPTNQ